jgi:phosphate transport system ATP-binding protein
MEIEIEIQGLNLWYGKCQALKNIDLKIPKKNITALIGPSGCGKSTLLRCVNRLNDFEKACKVEGAVHLRGQDINDRHTDVIDLRRRVGMVFQRANPFPFSIWENVAYGPKMAGIKDHDTLDKIVIKSLKKAAIYEEVRERLDDDASNLSGGQQQRLCIARTLAMEPEVILMDEPCSALDPIATAKIEEMVRRLRDDYCIVMVTHNMQQARRVSDRTSFMLLGEMIEVDETKKIFEDPVRNETKNYIAGKFG